MKKHLLIAVAILLLLFNSCQDERSYDSGGSCEPPKLQLETKPIIGKRSQKITYSWDNTPNAKSYVVKLQLNGKTVKEALIHAPINRYTFKIRGLQHNDQLRASIQSLCYHKKKENINVYQVKSESTCTPPTNLDLAITNTNNSYQAIGSWGPGQNDSLYVYRLFQNGIIISEDTIVQTSTPSIPIANVSNGDIFDFGVYTICKNDSDSPRVYITCIIIITDDVVFTEATEFDEICAQHRQSCVVLSIEGRKHPKTVTDCICSSVITPGSRLTDLNCFN